jgi:hypothetical protein
MSRVGFELTTPMFEQVKTFHSSDRVATASDIFAGVSTKLVVTLQIQYINSYSYSLKLGIIIDNKAQRGFKNLR